MTKLKLEGRVCHNQALKKVIGGTEKNSDCMLVIGVEDDMW